MDDFLAVLGIIGFALIGLALIWALERVWPSPRASCLPSPSWCSSISALRCSSPRSS